MPTDPTKAERDQWREMIERGESPGVDDPEAALHLLDLADEAERLRAEREQTAALLTEMRRYILYHGLLIGECVAWNQLKKLYGVNEDTEDYRE